MELTYLAILDFMLTLISNDGNYNKERLDVIIVEDKVEVKVPETEKDAETKASEESVKRKLK